MRRAWLALVLALSGCGTTMIHGDCTSVQTENTNVTTCHYKRVKAYKILWWTWERS